MSRKIALAALAAMTVLPATVPTVASAQQSDNGYRDNGYRDNGYRDNGYRNDGYRDNGNRNDRSYRGDDGRYYSCKKSSGTTGTVAGAVGGGVLGNVLGGGTLGTLAGAGGGALLGRHLDKKHDAAQNRKNGC